MRKIISLVLLVAITACSCATPDTPKTGTVTDTPHITPPDTAKYRPDSTKM